MNNERHYSLNLILDMNINFFFGMPTYWSGRLCKCLSIKQNQQKSNELSLLVSLSQFLYEGMRTKTALLHDS